jgi:hypothetical protein
MLITLGVRILTSPKTRSACLRVAAKSLMQTGHWWGMAGIPKPQEVPTMPQVESWDICKSENVGVGCHGKIQAFTRVFFLYNC